MAILAGVTAGITPDCNPLYEGFVLRMRACMFLVRGARPVRAWVSGGGIQVVTSQHPLLHHLYHYHQQRHQHQHHPVADFSR